MTGSFMVTLTDRDAVKRREFFDTYSQAKGFVSTETEFGARKVRITAV